MPIVDVTDILFDADIAGQSFTVLRRQETVNQYGESTWSVSKIPAIGSIQPSGEQGLMREGGYDAQAKTIKIVTTVRLRGASSGPNNTNFKPDIIEYNGFFYLVKSPTSWSSFGAGFIEAEADAYNWIDPGVLQLAPKWGMLVFSHNQNSGYAHGAGGF